MHLACNYRIGNKVLSAVKHEHHLFYKEVQDTEYKSAIRFLQSKIQIHRLSVFVMDVTVIAQGSVNSPCRAYSTAAVMASVAQATCSTLQRSAQQPAPILWRLPIGRLKGLHGAFLSSTEHRRGSSRQGLCLVVLPLPPAKLPLRSVVLSARAGEGRSVLGGSCSGRLTTCRVRRQLQKGMKERTLPSHPGPHPPAPNPCGFLTQKAWQQ